MIKPLGERVVIEVSESDVKTASGIVLPDTAKEKPQKGTVVAVGGLPVPFGRSGWKQIASTWNSDIGNGRFCCRPPFQVACHGFGLFQSFRLQVACQGFGLFQSLRL